MAIQKLSIGRLSLSFQVNFTKPIAIAVGVPNQPLVETERGYELNVPTDGVVRLSQDDFAKFDLWHEEKYVSENGDMVDVPMDSVGIGTVVVKYVGTQEEMAEFFWGEGNDVRSWLIERELP